MRIVSRSVASPLTDGTKTSRQPFRPSHILTGLGSPAASSLFRGGAFEQNTRIAEVSTMWKRDEAVKPSGPAAGVPVPAAPPAQSATAPLVPQRSDEPRAAIRDVVNI